MHTERVEGRSPGDPVRWSWTRLRHRKGTSMYLMTLSNHVFAQYFWQSHMNCRAESYAPPTKASVNAEVGDIVPRDGRGQPRPSLRLKRLQQARDILFVENSSLIQLARLATCRVDNGQLISRPCLTKMAGTFACAPFLGRQPRPQHLRTPPRCLAPPRPAPPRRQTSASALPISTNFEWHLSLGTFSLGTVRLTGVF